MLIKKTEQVFGVTATKLGNFFGMFLEPLLSFNVSNECFFQNISSRYSENFNFAQTNGTCCSKRGSHFDHVTEQPLLLSAKHSFPYPRFISQDVPTRKTTISTRVTNVYSCSIYWKNRKAVRSKIVKTQLRFWNSCLETCKQCSLKKATIHF